MVGSVGEYSDRELMAGLELEVPVTPEDGEWLQTIGEPTAIYRVTDIDLPGYGEISNEAITSRSGSMFNFINGIEIRTPDGGAPLDTLPGWYRDTYNAFEDCTGRHIEPTGWYDSGTAGLHVHLSPIRHESAWELYELSREPWFQVFAGSSVARYGLSGEIVDKYDVTRMHRTSDVKEKLRRKGSLVGKRGNGHYEWRLPEPMLPDHFDLLAEFIERFFTDRDEAIAWAYGLVDAGDNRLTAVRRAREIGPDVIAGNSVDTSATAQLIEVA